MIWRLTWLDEIYLNDNELTEIPEAIGELSRLRRLNVSGNRLTTLPRSIGRLVQLQVLGASGNQLTELPETIGRLSGLQELDVGGNRLESLPEPVFGLAQLRIVDASSNRLTELPEAIGRLSGLQELDVRDNYLESLPVAIFRLAHLRVLDASSNRLEVLPEAIGGLIQLRRLSASGNRLAALPEAIGRLARLQEVDIGGNQLVALPNALRELRSLRRLSLHDNPGLALPPEVLGPTPSDILLKKVTAANPVDILGYYYRLGGGRRALNEAKLIFVGRGGVGKTSIVNRLMHGTFDPREPKTEGIQITPWVVKVEATQDAVRLNIWDFGGQEIMHATHQFFLTQRSLYLLVLNAREGEQDSNVEYWLRVIESFGAGSPVIVVINKVREHPFDLNRRGLEDKFPSIRAFVRTDCEDGTGLAELDRIIRHETNRLEHLRDSFPEAWFKIKKLLADLRENYITYESYREFCAMHGEPEPKSQDTLVNFLHHLGIVINFKDDPRLQDKNVLKPEWVTNGIYTLLNSPTLSQQNGELRIGQLAELLDTRAYPREVHGYLMGLMEKFELCFEFEGDRGRYLVPELLGKEEPVWRKDFPPERCLNFQYRYNMLPEGLIPRLIVLTHRHSAGLPRWRTGVTLEFDGNRALVRADVQDRRVSISIAGPEIGRRSLLAFVRGHFNHIHRSIARLQAEEKVPVPGLPHLVLDYRRLLVREANGKTDVEIEDGEEVIVVRLRQLLDGIEPSKDRQVRRQSDGIKVVNIVVEGDSMDTVGGDKSTINAQGSKFTNSPVAIRQRLENSYNTAQQAPNDSLRQAIEQLCGAVADLLTKIQDPKQSEDARDNLETFVKEATKPEPRRKWLELTRDGLIEAAKTVGEMAGPVVAAVGKVMDLVP